MVEVGCFYCGLWLEADLGQHLMEVDEGVVEWLVEMCGCWWPSLPLPHHLSFHPPQAISPLPPRPRHTSFTTPTPHHPHHTSFTTPTPPHLTTPASPPRAPQDAAPHNESFTTATTLAPHPRPDLRQESGWKRKEGNGRRRKLEKSSM